MARDGTGTYVPIGGDFVNGTVIDATEFNAKFNDIGNALTQSLSRDGQTVATGNLPMGGFRHTGVGAGQAGNQYATVTQVQTGATTRGGTAGGTANAITTSLSPAPSAIVEGLRGSFVASATNTDSVTLNVNSLGAQTLRRADGAEIKPGVIMSGLRYAWCAASATEFRLEEDMSGWHVLERRSISGSPTTLAFDLPTGYSAFEFAMLHVKPSDYQIFCMQISVDGGANWLSGSGEYYVGQTSANGVITPTGLSVATLTPQMEVGSINLSGKVLLSPGNGSNTTTFSASFVGQIDTSNMITTINAGGSNTSTATRPTNVRFLWTGGVAFANQGSIVLTGLKG